GDQPADRERLAAIGPHLDGHLVGGAADPARANLDRGTHIVERIVEHAQRILARALGDAIERAVDDAFGNRLLALVHQAIHEFGDDEIAEFRIRQNFALNSGTATRHRSVSLLRPLGAVFRAALATILHALRIERAADDVIA